MLNTTFQRFGNSIFILHSFNINTVSDSTQYFSHKIVSLSSLVMLEKLTQCIRQGAILEVVDTNGRNASSHTHLHNALLPLAPRTHCSGLLTDAPSLCLSMKSTALGYFHLRDTFPRSHLQNLPVSVMWMR